MVGGFFCPPIGIIDGSVLTAVGELFAFAALSQVPDLVQVIREGRRFTISKGDFKMGVSMEPSETEL